MVIDFPLEKFAALSLSARRAWIEITPVNLGGLTQSVALRKESVDRNVSVAQTALKTG